MKWFNRKFGTMVWWETRLKNVAKSFGIKLSFAGIYFAHRAKEAHLNWRHMAPWLDHLDYIQRFPDF